MMKIELPTDFVFNWLCDLKKKEINPSDRAEILLRYMKTKKISQRELAKQLHIPHSTLQDWCMWSRLTKIQCDELHLKGLNDTDIYRRLRNNKAVAISVIADTCKLDLELEKNIKLLKGYIYAGPHSPYSSALINELKNILNRILIRIEK